MSVLRRKLSHLQWTPKQQLPILYHGSGGFWHLLQHLSQQQLLRPVSALPLHLSHLLGPLLLRVSLLPLALLPPPQPLHLPDFLQQRPTHRQPQPHLSVLSPRAGRVLLFLRGLRSCLPDLRWSRVHGLFEL